MDKIEQYLEEYAGNRFIRALVQLIPFGVGGAIDVTIQKTVDSIIKERARAFFDELNQNIKPDEALLERNDFIHAYFSTAKYALNTRRLEKIRLFARLLSALPEDDLNIDEFEELLHLLDDLSYREILALNKLDELSYRTDRLVEDSDYAWCSRFWREYHEFLTKDLKLEQRHTADFLIRICRTGCYELLPVQKGQWIKGIGKLTPTYSLLKKYVADQG
ncbi:hypothetical protein ACEO74_003515 [Vibrio cholerae]